MLSRLSARAIFKPQSFFGLSYARPASTEVVKTEEQPAEKKFIESSYVDFDPEKPVTQLKADYIPLPSPFHGPERDLVNFPKPVRLENTSPCRMVFIPEEWFKFLYPKLGVAGPYTLGIGIMATLISKEFYLIDDAEFKHTVAFFIWIYIFAKSPLGKMAADWNASLGKEESDRMRNFRKQNEKDYTDAIDHEKKEQWRQEGKKLLFQAKKEAIALQLEAAYRQNIMNLYQQVKKRLDYQVEVGKIESRVRQQFMVEWVVRSVQDAIAAQPEKETLKKCISDLNLLAAKA
ncbi:ATP synthase subunit b, mitochondrial-like [Planococcus citri]|uniref:ATP synthase subunit b, mitochondrial-like n=1 Tax=Planococcus citri TaxID=170843 RepID=UPI0031F7343A